MVNKLKLLGIPPSPVCDDGTFIRRATVDIAGRLPTDAETRAFIASSDPKKREQLVDRWSTAPNTRIISRTSGTSCCGTNVVKGNDAEGNLAFHAWIRDALYTNKPYDQMVREVVAASGDVQSNPPWCGSAKSSR